MQTSSLAAKGTTFTVDRVDRATRSLSQVDCREAIDNLLEAERLLRGKHYRPVEAWSRRHEHLVDNVDYHPLAATLHRAYADHRPVSLSPDMVWLLICQGVAHHVNANAEALRSRIVQHQDRVTLEVRRDEFLKGSPDNDWPPVFGEFSSQLREHIGSTHDLFVPSFSTTGPVERAASEIVLMDAVQRYFHFMLMKMICGIPAISLEGTPDDWRSIADRLEGFAALDLDWWLTSLRPIVGEFVEASRGHVDRAFWRSIYRRHVPEGECMPDSGMGWIHLFFPYLTDREGAPTVRNPWLTGERDPDELLSEPERETQPGKFRRHSAIQVHEFVHDSQLPSGLARAPFTWMEVDRAGERVRAWNMQLLAGFVGVYQDPETLGLRPEIGWAVREEPTSPLEDADSFDLEAFLSDRRRTSR